MDSNHHCVNAFFTLHFLTTVIITERDLVFDIIYYRCVKREIASLLHGQLGTNSESWHCPKGGQNPKDDAQPLSCNGMMATRAIVRGREG